MKLGSVEEVDGRAWCMKLGSVEEVDGRTSCRKLGSVEGGRRESIIHKNGLC